jgi:hypothetical protein
VVEGTGGQAPSIVNAVDGEVLGKVVDELSRAR